MLLFNPSKIYLDFKPVTHFVKFELHQKINEHHTFEIVLDNEYLPKSKWNDIFTPKGIIGKTLSMKIGNVDFYGIVTAVDFKLNKEYGHTKLKGYSRTILLESGTQLQSWTDTSLQEIVEKVTENIKVDCVINTAFQQKIYYHCQYRESNFRYLQRLAKQYNEWFYYNGNYLFFGKPKTLSDDVVLKYPNDIEKLEIKTQTLPVKKQVFENNFFQDTSLVNQTKLLDSPGFYMQYAVEASLNLFPKPVEDLAETQLHTMYEVDKYLANKLESTQATFDVIEIKSTKKGLTVGSIISIKKDADYLIYIKYLITEIHHFEGENQEYYNTFKAIPSGVKCLPEPDLPQLIASPQKAKVVDNEDELGKGRVKVKMAWQNNEMATNWIQVLTPDGGSSKAVEKNRGFVFIPEVGDEVLIGFQYNDPNRPFVMGSFFNYYHTEGGKPQNIVKSIATRSGNNISLNDKDGSLTIKDKGKIKNIILGGNGVITLNAEAKKEVFVGKDKAIFLMDNEGNITLKSTQNFTVDVGDGKSSITLDSNGNITIKAKNITIKGNEKVDIQGKKGKVVLDNKATISGDEVDIN